MNDNTQKIQFAPNKAESGLLDAPPWKLLIVDDEPEVHSVTRLALSDFRYDGRGLEFLSAYSGEEARERIAADPEIAVMLLDVVMESDDAGLQVVQYVRRMLGNSAVRIILRTGHPGMAPERRIIKAYDINDYRAKTELTQDRMHALMYTSLRAYKRTAAMAKSRRQMATLLDEYRDLLHRVSGLLQGPAIQLQAIADQAASSDEVPAIAEHLQVLARKLELLSDIQPPSRPPELFDANVQCLAVLTELAEEIEAWGGKVDIQDLPSLTGQPRLFRQLIGELIRNAMAAQPDGNGDIEISAEASGKDWVFTVADRGVGVPLDHSETIFSALSGDTLGTGLARCRRIVALHGGRIWVTPRSGGGSNFCFSLPATADHSNES